ncbi:MAG: hypothetical protein RRY22_04170 [Bacilli bacterium]
MREITKQLINDFNLKKIGYDFMGYDFTSCSQLSFHHLIVPKRLCKAQGLGEGYLYWNGVILRQNTSHDYLHLIERIDRDRFLYITKQLIIENEHRKIEIIKLKLIRDALTEFERENSSCKLIKNEYTKRLVKLDY